MGHPHGNLGQTPTHLHPSSCSLPCVGPLMLCCFSISELLIKVWIICTSFTTPSKNFREIYECDFEGYQRKSGPDQTEDIICIFYSSWHTKGEYTESWCESVAQAPTTDPLGLLLAQTAVCRYFFSFDLQMQLGTKPCLQTYKESMISACRISVTIHTRNKLDACKPCSSCSG
jgi:hypothetical protein